MSPKVAYALTLADALAWLTLRAYAGRGAVTFCLTENGDMGLFLGDSTASNGHGNTCEEALLDAHRRWHEAERDKDCDCERRMEQGDV